MFSLEDSNTIEYIKKICQDSYFKKISFFRTGDGKIAVAIYGDDFYNRSQFFSNLESHINSKDIILSLRSDAIDSIIDYLDSSKNNDSSGVYTFMYDAARNTFDIYSGNTAKKIAAKVALNDLQNFIGGSKEIPKTFSEITELMDSSLRNNLQNNIIKRFNVIREEWVQVTEGIVAKVNKGSLIPEKITYQDFIKELSDVRMKALADKSDLFNKLSDYVKQLILKSYQEGTIDIKSMTEQDFNNYIKNIIENNIFKNNSNLNLSDFIKEIQATENLYKESSLDKIFQSLFDGKYGTDQGIFRDKDIRKEMKLELMKEYNMSAFDAELLMENLDSVGACSYAAAVNDIISSFRYRPNQFEIIFGFPLYKKNSSGSYAINCARLLADMYIWFNSAENGGRLFYKKNGKFKYSNIFKCISDFSEQNYVMFINEGMIKPYRIADYVCSKSSYIRCKTKYINGLIKNELTDKLMQGIKNNVAKNLNNGNEVTLAIIKQNSEIRFIDMDTGKTYMSTFNWNEGGGHAVKVTGMTDTGFIVSTWGKRCLVPFKDLQKSGGFATYVTEFK